VDRRRGNRSGGRPGRPRRRADLPTIAAALAPFLTDAGLDEKVATSLVYLAIGISIGS
jgi:hypothetical protein